MQLYANPRNPLHFKNNERFLSVIGEFPVVKLFQPSPEKAPWHVQCVIDGGGYPQLINFWPHSMKGQRDGHKSVEGEAAIRGIIEQAIIDSMRPEEAIELFEE